VCEYNRGVFLWFYGSGVFLTKWTRFDLCPVFMVKLDKRVLSVQLLDSGIGLFQMIFFCSDL